MKKTRILVAEDPAIRAQDLSEQLTELGYQPVAQAATGEEALLMAGQVQPDRVLMDVRLAGSLDGITTARTIQERFFIPVGLAEACPTENSIMA